MTKFNLAMQLSTLAFMSVISISSFGAGNDSATCNVDGKTIVVTFDANSKKVAYQLSSPGSATVNGAGLSYNLLDRNEAAKDQGLNDVAYFLQIPMSDVASVAEFVISQETDGSFTVLKFNDSREAVLRTVVVAGDSIAACN